MDSIQSYNLTIIKLLIVKYRKRPCINHTFFHKIEAKNRGCSLSMDTSVFGVLKNQLFRCFLLPSWQIRRLSY